MKKEMTGGTKITLIISGAAMLAGIVIVVLFAAGALALSEQSRNVLAIAISAALVVFSYTLCKSLGVLKNQKSDSYPQEKGFRLAVSGANDLYASGMQYLRAAKPR